MEREHSIVWRLIALAVSVSIGAEPMALAQAPAASPPASATATSQSASRIFSQKDLDELLAPIALYPDALLAQVLMASTYPLEVVQAGRWQQQNAGLKEKELEQALQGQPWDPAVKSLAAVPQVLTMMNEKLDWTTKLGDAVLAQQDDVLKTVQSLRKKADEAGNLKTSEQMVVTKASENSVQVIKIESPQPDVVYVPSYDPATVYGPWWYPYPPPYYYYPPGYAYYPGLAFATGIFVGAAIWGGLTWGGGGNSINIDVNRFNNFNGSNISNKNWGHNVDHRKGVAYRDNASAQKYNRGGDRKAAASREQFRGRAEQGRSQLAQMDRGQLNRSVSGADRGTANRGGGNRAAAQPSQRGAGTGNRGGSVGGSASQRSNGFSGAGGGGASTRAASSRGGSSRSSGMSRGGGGGRGGGGRR